ncbi:hypothetical protein A4A49_41953 [Nicotiana attenuata]|uniref:Uncharacterized protein n=1 Tax=Nicotiana attenuata TaxID=49451 RepID=A0A1J6KIV5_NICAT|nr:hypothetical protein A4A49_41953 [Nicotiana attenuata]
MVFDENTLPYMQPNAPLDSSSDSTHIATFYEFFSRLQDTSILDVHSSNSGEVLNGSPLIGVGDQPTTDVNAPSSSDQLTLESPIDALDETAEPTLTTDHNAAEPTDHNAEPAEPVEPTESPLAAVPAGRLGIQLKVDLSHWFNTEPNQDTQVIPIQATPADDAEPLEHTSNAQSHYMITRQKSKYMPVRHMCMVAAKEPHTINEALSSLEWLASMQEEKMHFTKTRLGYWCLSHLV